LGQYLNKYLFRHFIYLVGVTFDINTTHSTWLGSPMNNLFNTYCTREWWNTNFRLKWVCQTDTSVELPYCSYRQI